MAEKGSIDYEKILLVKCTKSIDDMGAPFITPWIQDSIIRHTTVLSAGWLAVGTLGVGR